MVRDGAAAPLRRKNAAEGLSGARRGVVLTVCRTPSNRGADRRSAA